MTRSRLTLLICILLALITLAAYWRVLGCGFVSYDDDIYVTANRWVMAGLTLPSVKWALTTGHGSNWHPLTWVSHMADCELYGMRPLGHHLTSLILHILSTVLLFLLLRRLTGRTWEGAFVAALFALHPLHVESVAWIAERKDVLSTFLWMLTMHAWVSYVRRPGWGMYLCALGLFALGLTAKPMLVSLPLTLLLLDYWPLSRLGRKGEPVWKLVWEKAPFFALSGVSCIVTCIVQSSGAVVSLEKIGLGVRISNALVSYVAYLGKMFWPARLAAIYPHPMDTLAAWQVIGSALLLAAITVLVLRAARAHPFLAVGWLWYVITLVPVIGLVQVGLQSMADRYTYVPLIGIFAALTWLLAGPISRLGRVVPVLLPVAVICACGVGAWRQVGVWENSLTLFRHAVSVTERNSIAEANLGAALIEAGDYEEAIARSRAAIRIKPGARPYNNIGVALMRMDRPDEAAPYLEKAIGLDPGYAPAYHNIGYLLFSRRRYAEAVDYLRDAVSRDPQNAESRYYLAHSLAELGQADEAVEQYRLAVERDPRHYQARFNLGVLLSGRGDHEEAVEQFRAAVRIRPRDAKAHHNLGDALDALERTEEAMQAYREAIRIKPGLAEAHNNLAIDLYTVGRYAEAWQEVRLARKHGQEPHPGFIEALSGVMPEPR